MAHRTTRQPGVRTERGRARSPEASLAAAHTALDTLEKALRALPQADHLIDLVLQVRRGVIEAAARYPGRTL
jgi:hypothetical protein